MNAVAEYRKERARRGPDVDGLTADAAITELDDAKTAVLSRLDVAESETDRLRTLFQKAKNAMTRAEGELAQKELVCTRLRTSWREDTADLGDFDAALHSAFQDYRDDFPDSSIEDFDKWLACHVECGKEMLAP